MASGWQGEPYLKRYGRELALEPAISSKKSWGPGVTVERLFPRREYQLLGGPDVLGPATQGTGGSFINAKPRAGYMLSLLFWIILG